MDFLGRAGNSFQRKGIDKIIRSPVAGYKVQEFDSGKGRAALGEGAMERF
jgi:hypothetical protein